MKSIQQKFSRNFSSLDIYGVGFDLNYNQRKVFQSNLGAIASISIVILITLRFYFSFLDIINKKSPEVIQSEQYQPNPEKFNMKNDTFNFSIGIQYPKNFSHFIDESIYEVLAQQVTMTKVLNNVTGQFEQIWNYKEIPMKPCSKENFQLNQTSSYFNNLPNINQMYCLKDLNQEMFIQGNFDQDYYALIRIEFRPCTGKPYCRKNDEIQKILTSSFVAMYMSDVIVNPGEYSPFDHIGKEIYWNNSPRVQRDVDIYFKNILMHSDEGLLFSDIKTLKSTQFSYFQESVAFEESKYFFATQLRFEKQKQINYVRQYKKIDRLLADIGGISRVLIMIGFIFINPLNQIILKQKIVNDLFQFKRSPLKNEKKLQNTGKNVKSSQQMKMKSLAETNNLSIQENQKKQSQYYTENSMKLSVIKSPNSIKNLENQELKQSLQQNMRSSFNNLNMQQDKSYKNQITIETQKKIDQAQEQIMQNGIKNVQLIDTPKQNDKYQKFRLSWFQCFKYYLYPWGEIQEIRKFVEETMKTFSSHLDVRDMIKKQTEFEKIKQLLLDNDQVEILEFSPKPTLEISQLFCHKNSNFSFIEKQLKQKNTNLTYQQKQIRKQQKNQELEIENKQTNNQQDYNQIDQKILKIIESSNFNHNLHNQDYFKENATSILKKSLKQPSQQQQQIYTDSNISSSQEIQNTFQVINLNSKNKIHQQGEPKTEQNLFNGKSISQVNKLNNINEDQSQQQSILSSSSLVFGQLNQDEKEDGQVNPMPQTNRNLCLSKF